MSDAALAGQKAALTGDASLDRETLTGVENQLNSDSESSTNTGGGTVLDQARSEPSNGTSQAAPKSTESGDIPTGLDAIKAGGPQEARPNQPYSEPTR